MGTMRILDETGDTMVRWRTDDAATLERAEAVFGQLSRRRQLAFARPEGATAEDAERIYAFDPTAEEIIWVRPIAGG